MKRTPHREPIVAALARRDQLTSRIGAVDPHAVPRIAAPPVSFAAALSENARLEQVLSSLTVTRSEPHDDEASDELRPVVDDHDAPLLGDVPSIASAQIETIGEGSL